MDTSSPDIHVIFFFLKKKQNVKSTNFFFLSSFSLSGGYNMGQIYKMEFASAWM